MLFKRLIIAVFSVVGIPLTKAQLRQTVFTPSNNEDTLRLKHIFHQGIDNDNLFRRLDFQEDDVFMADYEDEDLEIQDYGILSAASTTVKLKTKYENVLRPDNNHQYYKTFGRHPPVTTWRREDIMVPDVTDQETVISLAKMTHNSYLSPKKNKWYDMGDRWQKNSSFGWEKDGLRGYVFGNEANTTLVLSIKGTSAAFLWMGDGETSANDKVNDNLLFSCCCGRVDATWSPVCDCYMGSNMCNQTCVEQSLTGDSVYYNAASKIFFNVADMYPTSSMWFTGHSLGGAVAGLIGLTFGIPTVTFEAPGELMAAKRLHLPMPPGIDMQDIPVWHFGHNADPIYTGSCTGAGSSCYFAGYAMESKCHTGKSCVYDVVSKYGWKADIRSHRIDDVIEKVLKPWENVTYCAPDKDCVDCGLWKYVD